MLRSDCILRLKVSYRNYSPPVCFVKRKHNKFTGRAGCKCGVATLESVALVTNKAPDLVTFDYQIPSGAGTSASSRLIAADFLIDVAL